MHRDRKSYSERKHLYMKRVIAIFFGALLSFSANAQVVVRAENAVFQPTIKRDESGYISCGVRSIVAAPGVEKGKSDFYEFSVNVYVDDLLALIKAGKYSVPYGSKTSLNFKNRVTTLPNPVSFWVAARGQSGRASANKIIKSDTNGFILGSADFRESAEVMYSIASSMPMQFALKYPNQEVEKIVSFKSEKNNEDRDEFMACMKGLRERLQRQLEADEKR